MLYSRSLEEITNFVFLYIKWPLSIQKCLKSFRKFVYPLYAFISLMTLSYASKHETEQIFADSS